MRSPDSWLARLRIVVGLWFFKASVAKLHWTFFVGLLPVPTVSERWMDFRHSLLSKIL